MVSLYLLDYAPFLADYLLLIAFLAPLIGGGEIGVMAVAVLFARDAISFWVIVLGSVAGMLVADSFWFFVAKSRHFKKLFFHSVKLVRGDRLKEKRIETIAHKRDIVILMLSKIMVGTRILIMIYLGTKRITYRKFLLFDLGPTFVWGILMVSLGWLMSEGFERFIEVFKNVQIAITLFIGFLLGVYFFVKWINRRILDGKSNKRTS